MTSSLAWLDFSERDQRRAREIIQLFLQPESRDELGVGTVRDAISDLLFPGISVIQTRARYFLFVPWLFKEGARRGKRGRELLNWVDNWQRRHVETLRQSGAVDGLIGRIAGARVKILPSTIYWHALQRFDILRVGGAQEFVAAIDLKRVALEDALQEESNRAEGVWQRNIPPVPVGFPDVQDLNFDLTEDEADWLSERLQDSTAGTPLAWLASRSECPTSSWPWSESLFQDAPTSMRALLGHSEMFSLAMHGAALLYNLLLARRWEELKYERAQEYIAHYEGLLESWGDEISSRQKTLHMWNRSDMWGLVHLQNGRIKPQTRTFIDTWCDCGVLSNPKMALEKPALAQLIAQRERDQKKGQARLANDRLMSQWGGSSGSGRLAYRWDRVRTILTDIAKGRSHATS
ncbi:MAG: DUF6361 family protein [Rhodoferax sp.]